MKKRRDTRKIVLLTLGVLFIGAPIILSKFFPSIGLLVKGEERVESPVVSVLPEKIIQGDPVLVSIESTSPPTSVTYDGQTLETFPYDGKLAALVGVDLNAPIGTSTIVMKFADGSSISKPIVIQRRKKITTKFGIPPKLGGNGTASVQLLMNTLAVENARLLDIPTANEALWTEDFGYPVDNPIVTDIFGYSRRTGSYSISHKGTDFRARQGTEIKAMNKGRVELARVFRNYGNTVVIDHGLGLMTFYMHLSKMNVKVGDLVEKGQTIGLSGQTGYAAVPHLHLTVRINDTSVDPIVFLNLFK